MADTCPNCGSNNLIRRTGEDEPTIHYGRLECAECERFITWLQDPSTTITTIQRQKAIETLLAEYGEQISERSKAFLENIKDARYLTPKQRNYLNSLSLRYMGVTICLEVNSETKNPAPQR